MKKLAIITLALLLILCSCSANSRVIEPTEEELEELKGEVAVAAEDYLFELRKEVYEIHPDWSNIYYIHGPYVVFKDSTVVCICPDARFSSHSSQQVGDIEFSFPELGPQMYLYHDSKIIDLTEAYDNGMISDKQVKIIKEKYNGYNDENLWTTVTVKAEEK